MKRLFADLKKGIIKLEVENSDDLWFLNQIVEPKDLVSAKTQRKVRLGGDEDRSADHVKRIVFLTIEVEKVDYTVDSLRLSGKITQGPDDIPHGLYHTISVEPNSSMTLAKSHWFSYQLDKIEEACRSKPTNILILLMDREEAFFAKLKTKGYELISHIEGDVQKKDSDQKVQKEFFPDLVRMLSDYDSRWNCSAIIVASPSFWKEDLLKIINDADLKKKVILATASSVTTSGINEILRRPEVINALRQERISQEVGLVEDLLLEISRDGLASYGIREIRVAAESGAVKNLLVADSFLKEMRENNTFFDLEHIMKSVEQNKGSVTLISVEHEAGAQLKGLGGIAAILRYRINT
jgi:protein pelota